MRQAPCKIANIASSVDRYEYCSIDIFSLVDCLESILFSANFLHFFFSWFYVGLSELLCLCKESELKLILYSLRNRVLF